MGRVHVSKRKLLIVKKLKIAVVFRSTDISSRSSRWEILKHVCVPAGTIQ